MFERGGNLLDIMEEERSTSSDGFQRFTGREEVRSTNGLEEGEIFSGGIGSNNRSKIWNSNINLRQDS